MTYGANAISVGFCRFTNKVGRTGNLTVADRIHSHKETDYERQFI